MAEKIGFTGERIDITDDGATWLCLRVADPQAARRFCLAHRGHGKAMDAELKEHREKRSLDANAYFWVLVDKLAAATGQTVTDVYRSCVWEIGGNSSVIELDEEALPTFRRIWCGRGIGWQVEDVPSPVPGKVNVRAVYGSSEYNTAQMSRLIDNIVQDCKAVGIETLPPEKLEAMMEAWGREK